MKIACISDLHGFFPEIPECDLLLMGGDYCPSRRDEYWWYQKSFAPWIEEIAKKVKIIGVAGNHDFIFEEKKYPIPNMNWTYLQDSGIEWNGLNIYASPWQPRFFDWAFNADEPRLELIWSAIPDNTDILLLHGPPYGYGDLAKNYPHNDLIHVGSPSLTKRILEIKPKLVVAGHIHSGYGQYLIGENTIFVNASVVNEKYKMVNSPIVVEI